MLLKDLHAFNTVEDAAKAFAGNWKEWRNFMWFGSTRVNKPENVLLGYTQTVQTGIKEEADHKVVAKLLQPYIGEEGDPNFLVDDYGASICGDRDAATGFAIRVYDDVGNITEPFEKLFDLSQEWTEEYPLDDDVFAEVNHQRTLQYLQGNLPYLCEREGVAYSEQLASDITDILVNEEERDLDCLDEDEDILPLLKELGTPA